MKLLYRICAGLDRDKDGDALDPHTVEGILKSIRETAARLFGGSNTVIGTGSYKMDAGNVVVERSLVVEIYAGFDDKARIEGFAKGIAWLLRAESVLVSAHTCVVFEDVRS